MEDLNRRIDTLKKILQKEAEAQKREYDKHRTPSGIAVGGRYWIEASNVSKLQPKFYGPGEVIEIVQSPNVVKLKLREDTEEVVTVHVEVLKPANENVPLGWIKSDGVVAF